MCGRFTQRSRLNILLKEFSVQDCDLGDFEPRYNIALSQDVPAVRLSADGQRQLSLFRWGLIPGWADDPKIGYRMINARAESVATKPSFRSAFKKRRCLVVADGYYEWKKPANPKGKKQPYLIHMEDDRPFAFAGLWERWGTEDEPVESCTIITTDANEHPASIHDRMPVILSPEDYDIWLDAEFIGQNELQRLLRPYEGHDLGSVTVSTYDNSPRNQGPECVEPIEG